MICNLNPCPQCFATRDTRANAAFQNPKYYLAYSQPYHFSSEYHLNAYFFLDMGWRACSYFERSKYERLDRTCTRVRQFAGQQRFLNENSYISARYANPTHVIDPAEPCRMFEPCQNPPLKYSMDRLFVLHHYELHKSLD
jgi:hypothetical protein